MDHFLKNLANSALAAERKKSRHLKSNVNHDYFKINRNMHSMKVIKILDRLKERQDKLLVLFKEMMEAYGRNIYPVDLLAIGAIKRTMNNNAGFKLMVDSLNMLCSRALLRMQIDTALRFYAVYLVSDPHEFASQVMAGRQINRLKDADGKAMCDKYLVSKLSVEYSWLPAVYQNLCGYIHFSDQHLFSSVRNVNNEERSVTYELYEMDTKFPEFSWIEVTECFKEAVDIFIKYLEGWIFTKSNPEVIAKLKKKLKK